MRDTRSRWILRLCGFVMVLASVEFCVATVAVQIQSLPERTDFASYYLAGVLTARGVLPYDNAALAQAGSEIGFEHEQYPFLYPPPFALGMRLLAETTYERARQIWMLFSTTCILVSLWILTRVLRRQFELLGVRDSTLYWVLLGAFVPAALNSTGLHNDIRTGSVGSLLFLLLVLLAWAVLNKRSSWAGVALAFAVIVKVSPIVLWPWVVRRGLPRAVWIATAVLGLCLLPALLYFGASIGPDYWRLAIVPLLQSELSWLHNQSLDANLSRILTPSAPIETPWHLPVLKNVLSVGLSLGLVAIAIWALRSRRRVPALLPVELGFLVCTMLLVMKITWIHTLAAMLFVWPVLMVPLYRAAEQERPWAIRAGLCACAGFLLSSAHFPILWGMHFVRWPLVLVPSLHMWGLVLLGGTCLFVLRRQEELVE